MCTALDLARLLATAQLITGCAFLITLDQFQLLVHVDPPRNKRHHYPFGTQPIA